MITDRFLLGGGGVQWLATYELNAAGQASDPRCLVGDYLDNLYIGIRHAGGTASVMKVNSEGIVIWVKNVSGGDMCGALAVDGSGNVYFAVSNSSANGKLTIGKLDAAGDLLWSLSCGPATGQFKPFEILLAGTDVYFFGATKPSGGNETSYVIKTSTTGVVLARKTLTTPSTQNKICQSAQFDGANIVVTGMIQNPSVNGFLGCLPPDLGSFNWCRTYPSSTGSENFLASARDESSGDIFAASENGRITKFSAAGVYLAQVTYSSAGATYGLGRPFNHNGTVFATFGQNANTCFVVTFSSALSILSQVKLATTGTIGALHVVSEYVYILLRSTVDAFGQARIVLIRLSRAAPASAVAAGITISKAVGSIASGSNTIQTVAHTTATEATADGAGGAVSPDATFLTSIQGL